MSMDDFLYDKFINLRCDLDNLKSGVLSNINERIIQNSENINALDDRTKMFCPDRSGRGGHKTPFEVKVERRLNFQAKKINEILERLD